MRESDWSSDVCSSDLHQRHVAKNKAVGEDPVGVHLLRLPRAAHPAHRHQRLGRDHPERGAAKPGGREEGDQERQKVPYEYKGFYAISTDKECDVFRCEENGLLYVPGKNELFIYHEPKQKKRNSIAALPWKTTAS